jgi:hypothetical protein
MYPNKFYTEWLVNEIVKLNKKLRESKQKKDISKDTNILNHESGYCKAMTEVLEDLREVLNYGDEDGGNE